MADTSARENAPAKPITNTKTGRKLPAEHQAQGGADAPLLVKPRQACQILACGNTRLYELLAAGELRSFKDGKSRKIVMQSIRDYIERRVAESEQ